MTANGIGVSVKRVEDFLYPEALETMRRARNEYAKLN